MAEKRRVFKPEFREGAVRIVTETGKPIPEVAQDLGINETTLASWVSRAKRAGNGRSESEAEELARLRAENARLKKDNKELGMERDVLKRCMVLWVK
ncbi:transposase [Streptomyces sp. NPDC048462]|uniref:transposase n=1 Tax=Streptomyces sp. NPDC048462 TaxID=3365555 RepID=UPI0037161D1D